MGNTGQLTGKIVLLDHAIGWRQFCDIHMQMKELNELLEV